MLGRSEKSTQKRDSIFHHPKTKAVNKKKKIFRASRWTTKFKRIGPYKN
jgi:hypothetical protein